LCHVNARSGFTTRRFKRNNGIRSGKNANFPHHYFLHKVIRIKRIYEPKAKTDGCRILVDRVWPRGMKKEDAHLDHWMKEVAPSTTLRKWFAHDPEKWPEFRKKYHAELKKNSSSLEELLEVMRTCKTVTLLFSAKDEEHNQAIALRDYLLEHIPKAKS
jgi:uncharacterized protein YeaO (DUF488 family)